MTFKYEAMNSSGQQVENLIEATSEDEAIAKLRTQGLFPMKLTKAAKSEVEKNKPQVKMKSLSEMTFWDFCEEMASRVGKELVIANVQHLNEMFLSCSFEQAEKFLKSRLERMNKGQ